MNKDKIKLNQGQIKALRNLNVSVVYLFGSCAEGKKHPLSDVDIGVVFCEKKTALGDVSRLYNQLYDLFTNVFKGKIVDIVFLQRSALELRFDAITHGKVLYEVSKDERFKFEEKILLAYADFKPILKEFNQAILNRI